MLSDFRSRCGFPLTKASFFPSLASVLVFPHPMAMETLAVTRQLRVKATERSSTRATDQGSPRSYSLSTNLPLSRPDSDYYYGLRPYLVFHETNLPF